MHFTYDITIVFFSVTLKNITNIDKYFCFLIYNKENYVNSIGLGKSGFWR